MELQYNKFPAASLEGYEPIYILESSYTVLNEHVIHILNTVFVYFSPNTIIWMLNLFCFMNFKMFICVFMNADQDLDVLTELAKTCTNR